MFPATPRLRLRPFVPEDADVVFRYRSDPDVMRYILSGPDKSIEETQKMLDRFIKHHEKYEFSKWAVVLRETSS